jgi:hypothetical protein
MRSRPPGWRGGIPYLPEVEFRSQEAHSGTWTITNPKANAALTSTQINDLVVIAHYEVSWV